ncbi:cyclin-domain-containing protein [Gongronella butleri]|nr:cyclin-domain-containing protein [Gongronella butleri]
MKTSVPSNIHGHESAASAGLVNDFLTAPFNAYSQPQLLSFLMTSYMAHDPYAQPAVPTMSKPLPTPTSVKSATIASPQEQQRSYVNALVDVTVQAIASIWPHANTPVTSQRPIASLNTFLHHILKNSRTTHSTLQLAIFYLFRIRPKVQARDQKDVYIACGRRMFLAALICAHKFLQDKTYKNSAWSKVSGLHVSEINHAEKLMLQLLDYHLHVKKETYDQWVSMLQAHIQFPAPRSPPPSPTLVHSSFNPANTPPTMMQLSPSKLPATSVLLGMPTPVEQPIQTSPFSRKRKAAQENVAKKPRY